MTTPSHPTTGKVAPAELAANRILIIDDDPGIPKIFEKGLKKLGYTTAIARHGTDAAYLVLEFHPDLVLLDIMLPDLDGEQICRRIRANPGTRDLKIIAVSAIAEQAKIDAVLKAGANVFIAKPFELKKVAETIVTLIGPIHTKSQPSGLRHRPRTIALIGVALILLALIGFALALWFQPRRDVPPELATLQQLARALAEHDQNGDGQITAAELMDDTVMRELDRNRDGSIRAEDGRAALEALLGRLRAAHVDRAQWSALGGQGVEFVLLDQTRDGRIDVSDLARRDLVASAPTEKQAELPPYRRVKDTRMEPTQELWVDELQAAWLTDLIAYERQGTIPWTGGPVAQEHFGEGQWVRVFVLASGEQKEGFIARKPGSRTFTLLGVDGPIPRHFREAEVRIEELAQAPSRRWYHQHQTLAANDAEGWRALALWIAQQPDMRAQSADAARRSLVYHREYSELYPLVGVEQVKGTLRVKP